MALRRKRGRKKSRRKVAHRRFSWPRFSWPRLATLLLVLLAGYITWLDYQVRSQFDGKRWSLPARVYARPLELYSGRELAPDQFAAELRALDYRSVPSPHQPGEFSRNRDVFHLISRPFAFWDAEETARNLRIGFDKTRITGLTDSGGRPISIARLDPVLVGSFYPSQHEDRVLLQLGSVPVALIDALIAVEDRGFYEHHGIAPLAILRAFWANIRAGGIVQGGSTLTQQLAKNFFLTSKRTLSRKLNEALIALLLELHYRKDEILEAYLNEVYLGQDGDRAIHGFGLASHFYFDRPLAELTTGQYALLVGLVKGPSYYNPQRHPDRARARRDLVLDIMVERGLIESEEALRAKAGGLGVIQHGENAINNFPAFLDLVRRQLRRDYRDDDITSEGLRIFTTLDPQVQWRLEKILETRLRDLERGAAAGSLEAAAVVTSVQGGEVLALAGGRRPGYAGFNRALDASRQVGSLLKPAVYLTALEKPGSYTLATLLDDSPLSWTAPNGNVWSPRNYDKTSHGMVPLYQALAHSYNVATARLGLALGIESVIDTLKRIGVERHLKPYPSLLLGAVELSPLEVARMYQTFASGGFRMPLRAITAVLASDNSPLQRYALNVRAVVAPDANALITTALWFAAREGTGRALYQSLPGEQDVAGKTGTTDDLRDSWFAGFTSDRLGVVWIGRDDNKSTGLTGSSGALRLWRDLFAGFHSTGRIPPAVETVEYQWIDPHSGLLADAGCPDAVQLPFIGGSAPLDSAPCAAGRHDLPKAVDWFRELFE